MIEFENLAEFRAPTSKPRIHTMPYNWGGTGHLVLNDCIYFNRFNTSNIVQVIILCVGRKIIVGGIFKYFAFTVFDDRKEDRERS